MFALAIVYLLTLSFLPYFSISLYLLTFLPYPSSSSLPSLPSHTPTIAVPSFPIIFPRRARKTASTEGMYTSILHGLLTGFLLPLTPWFFFREPPLPNFFDADAEAARVEGSQISARVNEESGIGGEVLPGIVFGRRMQVSRASCSLAPHPFLPHPLLLPFVRLLDGLCLLQELGSCGADGVDGDLYGDFTKCRFWAFTPFDQLCLSVSFSLSFLLYRIGICTTCWRIFTMQ